VFVAVGSGPVGVAVGVSVVVEVLVAVGNVPVGVKVGEGVQAHRYTS
jgi:hypothetical protein